MNVHPVVVVRRRAELAVQHGVARAGGERAFGVEENTTDLAVRLEPNEHVKIRQLPGGLLALLHDGNVFLGKLLSKFAFVLFPGRSLEIRIYASDRIGKLLPISGWTQSCYAQYRRQNDLE